MKIRSGIAAVTLLWAGGTSAEQLAISAGYSELVFDGRSASPVAWYLCELDCARDNARRITLFDIDDGHLRFVTQDEPAPQASALAGPVSIQDGADVVTIGFTTAQGELIYRLSKHSPELQLEVPPGIAVALASGAAFVPEQLPGFGAMYSRVLPVQISGAGQRVLDAASEEEVAQASAEEGHWIGVRNRYWAFLVQPEGGATVYPEIAPAALNRPVVTFPAQTEAQRYRIYAGSTEWAALKSVAPELSELLFAALWDFLRVLTFGMMLLLDIIYGWVGHYGVAIILLSLTVKVLMYPLTALADKWQRQVNATASLLQPELDAIRRSYKGEEAHMRTLAVYKKHNISQLYTFKSAAGFLIQIPVFIAAFDMLGENFALSEASFLWIGDLAKPDHLAALPFTLPFFGGYLNLLPFLMTALSVLAAVLQREATLSAALQRQQSQRLYLMATAFFVLFYTFPAGMVLYWTSSNLFHLLKVESARWFVRE